MKPVPPDPNHPRHLLSDDSLCIHCVAFRPLSASNCHKVEALGFAAAANHVEITVDRCPDFTVKTS